MKDKKRRSSPDRPKTFRTPEDGAPQTIKYFAAESNLPLTLGILIDTSGSQMRVLEMEKEVGGAFLNDILREKDEAFLIGFDVNVDLLQDFTNDVHRLKAAMNKTRINTGGGGGTIIPGGGGNPVPTGPPRGTLLYDAVYLAAHDELAHEVGRKAMILLTDGEISSQLRRDALRQPRSDCLLCAMIADRGFYGGFGYRRLGDEELANGTGGRVIDIGNKMDEGSLRSDRERATQPVQHRLHAHQYQPGRRLS
jgi:Mg-chelatase subunit ChlD